MKAAVYVTLKKGILDPQGKAIQKSLHTIGHSNIQEVRQGKYFEVQIDEQDEEKAKLQLKKACEQLLSNPVIEDYHFEFIK